jgi:hypothetical protein
LNGPLRRFTNADFLQQIGKNLQTTGRHMPELASVKLANRLVESLEKAERLRRDAGLHDAAVVGLAYPGNQGSLLETVEEPGHIRVVGDHAFPDAPTGQTFRFGPAEDAKNIVLRAGKPRGLQKLFGFLAERVSGPEKCYENAVLQGEGGSGGLGV